MLLPSTFLTLRASTSTPSRPLEYGYRTKSVTEADPKAATRNHGAGTTGNSTKLALPAV